MDLFSFPCFPSSGEISASPLSIGLEFGELDTYLGNQGHFHVPTSGIGHYETTLQASTNNPLGASIDFPEMLRSNTVTFSLSPTEFPLNEINYNIEDLNILSPIPNADTTVSSSSINNEGNSLMLKEEPKKRKRRPEPMTDVCRICGDIAPPHNHYGAIACFSCRAFFGRTVHKGTQERFRCVRGNPDESGLCSITKASRTHCPFCRYRGCLSAGMKPSYVTSAEERLLKKKKNTKRTRRLQLLNIIQLKEESLEDSDLLPPFRVIGDINIPLSSSGSYPTMCFMIEQRGQLEHRIQSRQYTWHSIALGVSLICELFRLGSSYRSIPPSHSNDIEVTVTLNESLKAGEPNSSINEDYVHLHERTNPVLRINVSSHFSSRVGLKEQLLETIGSSKDYIPQKTPPPMTTLFSLKQVFANPWCHRGKEEGLRDESCGSRIDQTLERMEKLNLDPKVETLLSIIPFFGGTDDPYETEFLSKVQEEINMVLFQHVYESLGPRLGRSLFSKIMSIIVDLQEMVTRCSKTRLDFKIAPFGL